MAKPSDIKGAGVVSVSVVVDLDTYEKAIKEAPTLHNSDALFKILSNIAADKKEIKEALETIEAVESIIKDTISKRMKSDEGDAWEVVEGEGYRITRSKTGSVYDFNATYTEKDILKIPADFVKVDYKPNAKNIDEYIKAHSSLPGGIMYNPHRGDKITINLLDRSRS